MALISDEQLKLIAERYIAGDSTITIALLIGCAPRTVGKKLALLGIPRRDKTEAMVSMRQREPERFRKFECNHSYFSDINTPEKAYWLGFFGADGTVSANGVLTLQLATFDREHVEKFKLALNAEYPVYDEANGMTRMSITSHQLRNDLARLNIRNRLKIAMQWPKFLSTDLQRAFALGNFDGDGGLSVGPSSIQFNIAGPQSFIEGYQKFLVANLDLSYTKIITPNHSTRTRVLKYGGMQQVVKICHFLHDSFAGFLPRKLEGLVDLLCQDSYHKSKYLKDIVHFQHLLSKHE